MDSQGDHKPGPVGKGAAGDEYKKPQLVVADGLLVMPGALQHWEKIMSFQARPDDTFIASYPKSGLMWTTQVMNMIKLQGDVEAYKVNKTLIPFLEFCRPDEEPAVEKINNLPSPRVINIHAPISHISKSILENKCKVICVLRNPKDVAVSFYHFHTFNNMLPNPGTWSEFLQNFMIGKVGFNSWFDHVKGWWSLREQPNIFFLFYEGMKKDLGYEAGRLASFLGHDLSPEAIKNLVEQLSFNAMKAKMDEKFSNMTSPAGFTFKQFLRKGDHKPGPVGKGAAGDEYKKPQLVVADGLLVMPGALQHWEKIMSFQARPDDTFIASYPKSGLVWTTQVMNMIKLQGDVEAYKVKKTLIPFLEFCRPDEEPAVEKINNLPSPRVINIHAPISHISKSILENKCKFFTRHQGKFMSWTTEGSKSLIQQLGRGEHANKVICVLRNPKDVAVSFYHFHTFNNMLPNPGTWSEFLQNFMIGKVMCNSWFDHVKGWWSLREQPNIFFLFYEGMKKDLGYEAGRLASFLGQDLSPEAIKNLVEQLSFNAMKANMDEMFPNVTSPAGFTFKQFLRKGQVGDWKNHFTVAQNEVMDQLITDQLQGTSLDFCYEL